jgi:cyclophilin family peptidyl-prolyl cis-trans isomerase
MRDFASRMWHRLFFGPTGKRRKPTRRPIRRAQLEVMPLEDRFVPSTFPGGNIIGMVYLDNAGTGIFNASHDSGLAGVQVTLNGQTSTGTTEHLTDTTDLRGVYTFVDLPPGTYQVSAPGSLKGVLPIPATGTHSHQDSNKATGIDVTAGVTLRRNLREGLGVDPAFLSLRQVDSSNPSSAFPFSVGASNTPPVVTSGVSPLHVSGNASGNVNATNIDLSGHFTDASIMDSRIRFTTNLGSLDVTLFDKQKPRTVSNFFNYILSHRYDNSIFHRRALSPNVLQGGGFTISGDGATPAAIQADPQSVLNEFGLPNSAGTIAMAKTSDPNSATDEFYFNVSDNSTALDNPSNSGGFTVFGKIASAADTTELNRLAAVQTKDESATNGNFSTLPLQNYTGTTFPTDAKVSNYLVIQDVEVLSRNDWLTYTVVGNTNPGLVQPSIANEHLTLNYTAKATGTAKITIQATDILGASARMTFTVSVAQETTAPKLTLPTNQTVEATGPTGASDINAFTASATDKVDTSPTITYAVNGTTIDKTFVFPLGTTTVNVTATNHIGKSTTGSFTVLVRDTTPPTLTLPANQTVEATGPNGATDTNAFTATATDLVTANPTIVYTVNGTTVDGSFVFPLGVTSVNVSATDAAGNKSTGTFTVLVHDTTPPTINPPTLQTVEATGPNGATDAGAFTATATDLVTANPTIVYSVNGQTIDSSYVFPLGATSVKITATDAAGNSSTANFTVIVQDTTPPTLTLPQNQTVSANGQGSTTDPNAFTATATDLVTPNPIIAYFVNNVQITSSYQFAVGVTTVTVTATDNAGNVSSGTFTVTVTP